MCVWAKSAKIQSHLHCVSTREIGTALRKVPSGKHTVLSAEGSTQVPVSRFIHAEAVLPHMTISLSQNTKMSWRNLDFIVVKALTAAQLFANKDSVFLDFVHSQIN